MPGGDRTGPMGQGPMTGRGAGYCSGNPTPGYSIPAFRPGIGRGRRVNYGRGFRGRGRGFWFRANIDNQVYQPTIEEEKRYYEESIKNLEDEIKFLKDKLKNLSEEKQ